MTKVNPASHEAYRLIAEDAIADDEYIRIGANALGICASGAADGIGTPPIAAPWPAVLEHAPTAELVAALREREEVYHFDRCMKATLEFPTLRDILAVPTPEPEP